MIEKWKDIVGYEGLYQVSSLGNVRSLDRTFNHGRYGVGFRKGQKLAKKLGTSKYYSVHLTKNGKRKSYLIHRIQAEVFLQNNNNLSDVNHKNLNKLDNRLENLEWVTRSENCLHAIKNGHKPDNRGEKSPNSKLTDKKVIKIRKMYKTGKFLQKDLAKKFNVSKSLIQALIANNIWTHL